VESKPAGAIKYDKGKPRASLVMGYFPRALMEIAKVSTMGAEKYAAYGWMHVPNALERYDDAMGRHYLNRYVEDVDPESDLDHLAHVAWNALAILELKLKEKK
jgi:hypothetical protein